MSTLNNEDDTYSQKVSELAKKNKELEERYNKLLQEFDEKIEHELEERILKEMTRVSSELAHDLRSPLQTITNSLFLMERKAGDLSYIPRINEALKHATAILDGFREYYRGHEITPMKSSVNKLLLSALEDISIPQNIRVEKDLDPKIDESSLDMGKVRLVFRHILKNAVEAMQNGGTLSIQTKDTGKKIEVTIKDIGIGIAKNDKDKVFMPFGLKKKGGLGLGLSASRRIVEAHKGKISFKSEIGKGTVFTVQFPK